jgi:hypothetical protein
MSKYPNHDQKVLAINIYFSIMSQLDTRVKRLSGSGALAIMESYSQSNAQELIRSLHWGDVVSRA